MKFIDQAKLFHEKNEREDKLRKELKVGILKGVRDLEDCVDFKFEQPEKDMATKIIDELGFSWKTVYENFDSHLLVIDLTEVYKKGE